MSAATLTLQNRHLRTNKLLQTSLTQYLRFSLLQVNYICDTASSIIKMIVGVSEIFASPVWPQYQQQYYNCCNWEFVFEDVILHKKECSWNAKPVLTYHTNTKCYLSIVKAFMGARADNFCWLFLTHSKYKSVFFPSPSYNPKEKGVLHFISTWPHSPRKTVDFQVASRRLFVWEGLCQVNGRFSIMRAMPVLASAGYGVM